MNILKSVEKNCYYRNFFELFSFLIPTLNMLITQPILNLKPPHVIEVVSHLLVTVSIFLGVFIPLAHVLGDHDSILEFLFNLLLLSLLNLNSPLLDNQFQAQVGIPSSLQGLSLLALSDFIFVVELELRVYRISNP